MGDFSVQSLTTILVTPKSQQPLQILSVSEKRIHSIHRVQVLRNEHSNTLAVFVKRESKLVPVKIIYRWGT